MHETLRRVILNGELAGGTRLVQADLAKQLGVSTTPVREALRDLATEGLIRLDPHRGAIVRELKLDEVREIYELRKLLEPVSIRRAVERITSARLDEAAELAAGMEAQDDPARWVELNRAFHAVFASASDSPRLETILEGLRDSAAVYVGLSIKIRPRQMTGGNADHRALLKAVRRGDADAAAGIEVRHLESTMRAIEAAAENVVRHGRSAS
ncbi:MAG: GntR family transcriptional regulator [Streptomycetales bacterium]